MDAPLSLGGNEYGIFPCPYCWKARAQWLDVRLRFKDGENQTAHNQREGREKKLHKRIVELEGQLAEAHFLEEHLEAQVDKAEKRVAVLREALEEHGEHPAGCVWFKGGKCDCGLEAALEVK